MNKLAYTVYRVQHDNILQAHIMIVFVLCVLIVGLLTIDFSVVDNNQLVSCAGYAQHIK